MFECKQSPDKKGAIVPKTIKKNFCSLCCRRTFHPPVSAGFECFCRLAARVVHLSGHSDQPHLSLQDLSVFADSLQGLCT